MIRISYCNLMFSDIYKYKIQYNNLYILVFSDLNMKGLIKKFLTPLIIAGTLFTANPASAQEKINPFISASVGIYDETSEPMQDFSRLPFLNNFMLRIRGGVGLDFFKNFRLEQAIAYMNKKGQPYGGAKRNIDLSILQAETIAYSVLPTVFGNLRAGFGLTIMDLKEKSFLGDNEFETEKKGMGIVAVLGGDMLISKKINLYGDFSWRFISSSGVFGDIGGPCFDVGLRYNF